MPSPPLRIGIAGVGHFGRYHALKVAASERAVLAGVFDTDAERARTVGREARRTRDWILPRCLPPATRW